MKFSYLILAVLLLTGYQSYAQNTFPWSPTGPVGIGTSNATLGLLHLNGSTADLLSMSQTNPSQVIQLNAYNNVDFRIIQRSNAVMTLWTNTLERMRIDQNGYVGIGTTTPKALFHVVGNGVSIDNFVGITNNDLAIQANTGGRSATTGAQLEFVIPANTDGTNVWGQARIITVAGNANSSDATGKMVLGTRRMFDKLGTGVQWYYGNDLVIDGSGNIGIGTLTPREALSVNGNIRSKQVKVELANWPDYVFKPDYQLPSLQEVKAYIDQNQHLPEVPSEQEIAKDGLNLGEMNKLLMKKVEELTLYLIDLQKQVNELKATKK